MMLMAMVTVTLMVMCNGNDDEYDDDVHGDKSLSPWRLDQLIVDINLSVAPSVLYTSQYRRFYESLKIV